MSIIINALYKKGFFARKVSIDQFMGALKDINEEGNFDAQLVKYGENQFDMNICPGGTVRLRITETTMEIQAVTSMAGPGFHKAAVDVLDLLEDKMGLHLDVDDPTDYHQTRAFHLLQKEHLQSLRDMLETVAATRLGGVRENYTEYLAWSKPWYPVGNYAYVTSFGAFSEDQIKAALDSDLTDFAKSYYTWFEESKSALYHKQIAYYLLWNEYKWRKPLTDEEQLLAHSIARHLEMARMIDADILLPSNAWEEICANNGIPYLNLNEAADDTNPIGYLKNHVHFRLPLGYALKTTGQFRFSTESDGVMLRDLARTIRIQPVAETGKEPLRDPRRMLNHIDYEFEQDGYCYAAQVDKQMLEQGAVFILQGYIQGSSTYAQIMIMFQFEQDLAWALQVLKDVETPMSAPINFSMLT